MMNDDRTAATDIRQDTLSEIPEAFTSQWHAFELGRLANNDGKLRLSPFDSVLFCESLSEA